ncbi:4-oxalocrotonate tautomerase [Marinobacter sp.]|uniref:tautomerase family protein n=1 Tax=Marinobacter sp. TaxID=50741 RepID=UPI0019BE06DB|nr:4-oxalocrotonate tautomerase [Marinobacter sp.]MBD3654940.1 4-oxalocrotonate tautomerase [Marinobacter sp.]
MPVVKFHVSGGRHPDSVVEKFLTQASEQYARILECPVDRVRAFYVLHDENLVAIKGRVPGPLSVFFEFIVLEGRSLEQRQKIATKFCELIEGVLDVDPDVVRGHCIRVEPEDWCIGGWFASDLRKTEIEKRKNP